MFGRDDPKPWMKYYYGGWYDISLNSYDVHSSYSPPPPYGSPHQHDLPPVVPSQTHPLPRVPPALSLAHSHYGSLPQSISALTLLPPPPPPVGPRSPAFPSHLPSSDRDGLVHSSRGNSLENMGGALDRLHSDENYSEEEEVESPIHWKPSAKALGKRMIIEEADDEHESSDESRRESVESDSDEEARGVDHTIGMRFRRKPTHYVYDAVAERTAQYLRERRVLTFALDTAGATSRVPTRPPVEEEIPASEPDITITASDHEKAIDGVIDPYWSGIDLDFSTDTVFAYSSKANLEKMLWEDALLDAQKVQ
ncbi:hypothetical protein EV702DRAFT_1121994 [Suillus placidus]|uniref:Uncharacterized protein n=1 Tax=Suillus placidus TaxID=48579 RepID=A0A9P7D0M8_9AGAM|nr:hypothetical protein EV702DRAFT_1121994 [Suillus placidus]